MLKTLKFKVFEPVRDQSPTHQSVGVVPVVLDLSLVPLGFRPSRRAERGQQRRTQHSSRPHGTPKNTHTNRRDFFIIKKSSASQRELRSPLLQVFLTSCPQRAGCLDEAAPPPPAFGWRHGCDVTAS